jgi:hypothetical protein
MNSNGIPSNPALAKALRILSSLAADDGNAGAEWTDAFVAELSPLLPAPAAVGNDVIGLNDAGLGLHWHAQQLAALCGAQALSPDQAARRRYHARLLGHDLAPERAEFRPLVTILIPVFNRAGPLAEAVASGLAQTWRPIEILVVDDGSTDDPAAALAHFGAEVRLCPRPHAGVAAARNFGIREARGDFVHFLDSDDLLTPDTVAAKLAAFRAVPDADLCYGQAQWTDMRTAPPTAKERSNTEVDRPLRAMIVGFPFLLQMTMLPRWRLLAAAPFEEDLRRSSDFRYWQSLGIAGIKAIGSRALGTRLRRFQDSLHLTPETKDDSHAVALLRGLRDIARHPHTWRHGAEYLNPVAAPRVRYWFEQARSARVQDAAREAAEALDAAARGSPSALPMFAAMRAQRQRLRRDGAWPEAEPQSIYRLISGAIDRGCATARPLDDQGLAFWSADSGTPLSRFFAAIRKHAAAGNQASLASALLRQCPRLPRARMVRRAAFWQRLLGSAVVARLIAYRMARKRA